METILVTGASSLPGYSVSLALLERGYRVVGTYNSNEIPIEHRGLVKVRVDVRDYRALEVIFGKHRPEAVVHIAAYGDVDGCEVNRGLAWEVNAIGTTNVARLARRFSAFTVYLSTDYVFDGSRGGYGEYDPPNPVNYYGLTKLAGETAVRSLDTGYAIVRASSIYGLGPGRTNFAKHLIRSLIEARPVRALTDQYTSPTHSALLAEAMVEIIEEGRSGVFHVVGERMSRYEFALTIAKALNLDASLIKPARMSEFSWKAPRPRDSSLSYDLTRSAIKSEFYSMERAMRLLKEELEQALQVRE